MERASFERCIYKKDIQNIPYSYCGEPLNTGEFYFNDIEESETAPKHEIAVCYSCMLAIEGKE